MTESEFIDTVRKMREFQKRYFKTRDNNVLACCKALEKEVDEYLANEQQPGLF